jgi:hypothetical protein
MRRVVGERTIITHELAVQGRERSDGVLSARGLANRWTFYIGKDGKILAIGKTVKPATSAEDMAAKLGGLGVEPKGTNDLQAVVSGGRA